MGFLFCLWSTVKIELGNLTTQKSGYAEERFDALVSYMGVACKEIPLFCTTWYVSVLRS